jgi:tetrathionate reductase subunit B
MRFLMANVKRYVMILDLGRCVGCNACTVACKTRWNAVVPATSFRSKVKTITRGTYPAVSTVFRRTACMHCAEAPCVDACPVEPVKASRKNEDGVTIIDRDLCVQCGECVNSCPYKVRTLNTESRRNPKADGCDFCYSYIKQGDLPACVANCVGKVFTFGEINDPEIQKKLRLAEPLRPDFGTKPSVYYIPHQCVREWQEV